MKNKEIAQIFYKISQYLRIENIPFKPYAYYKAGEVLASLDKDIQEIYQKGGLKDLEKIPGIGKNIALKIEEYLKTDKIKYFEELKKETPIDLEGITAIEGLGPKRAKLLYEKLKVKNLKELEQAAKKGKIRELFGFDEKIEKNILQGIEFFKQNKEKFLLSEALLIYDKFLKILKKEVEKIEVAGSIRRKKETVKDIDILAVTKKPDRVMEIFTSQKEVIKVWGKGKTKSSIRIDQGIDLDLRVVPLKSYGAALQYFTGSREHNIVLRKRAKQKGLKLNEYGLFKKEKQIAGKNEKEIYKKLGLPWIPPELREDGTEIGKKIPQLIELKDIKGDLHCHTNWGAAKHSIEQMYQKAKELNYHYLGISDHTKFLGIEKGLNEKELIKQSNYIKKLREKGYLILHGCEANILKDGSLDIKNSVLKELDFVIAGVHSGLNQETTSRILKAMENQQVNIISHLTGRLINKRKESIIDIDRIMEKAKQTNTVLEINAYPQRLDLKVDYIKRAKKEGIKMIINSDAHEKDQLENMKYGLFQAKRGWLEPENIINSLSFEEIILFFQKQKN